MQLHRQRLEQSSNWIDSIDSLPAGPRPRVLRPRVLGCGGVALLALAASACSGGDFQGETADADGDGSAAVGSVKAALNSSDICSAINQVADIALASSAFSVDVGCGDDDAKSTAYLGSSTKADWATSNTVAESQALYCAIQATDGHNAVAQIDTPLGKFGMRSRIAVLTADPANLHVTGQRVGQLVAFDQYLDTESQTFDFDSPTEWQSARSVIAKRRDAYPLPPKTYYQHIPAQRGQYSVFTTSGHHFNLHADAEFPIAGPFNGTVFLDFQNRTPYDGHNAFAYAMTPQADSSAGYFFEQASEAARRDSFHAMQVECKACQNSIPEGGINTCGAVCPDDKIMEDHFRTCGNSQGFSACNDDYYSNLSDARLPYEGNYGASGPFVDTGVPNNWWHIGSPKNSQLVPNVPGEPVFSLLSGDSNLSSPTTHLGFGFGVNASIKIFKIALGLEAAFDFRDGLAIRESQSIDPDSQPAVLNHVQTWIDSEARARINATANVKAHLPWFGDVTLIDEQFNIIDKSVRSSSNAARYQTSASWSDGEPSSITSYKVGGVETDLSSCLDVPATSQPEIEVNNPRDVAGTIMDQAHNRVVPCNIVLCDPTTGTRNDCSWSSSDDSMSCTDSGESCACGDTHMDMCALDAAGNVTATYAGTPVGQNYCDQKAACGGRDICTDASQCGAGGFCDTGCCVNIK
ncbi:MAG: hypothetical protein ABUL60_24215 [Myxococcales bacterium]